MILQSSSQSVQSLGSSLELRRTCVASLLTLVLGNSSAQSLVVNTSIALSSVSLKSSLSISQSCVQQLSLLNTNRIGDVLHSYISQDDLIKATNTPTQQIVISLLRNEVNRSRCRTSYSVLTTIHIRRIIDGLSEINLFLITRIHNREGHLRTIVLPHSRVEGDSILLATLELEVVTLYSTILYIALTEVETLSEVTTLSKVEHT